jgi:lysyl endopeptidase
LSCQVDVSCTTPLPAASNAVIWLVYINNGGTYICSGTVLNNTASDGTPYVLTANHCISSQTVASTLYSEFNYRSASCNATSGNYFPINGTSAALLYTAYNTDTTLLRLNGALPAGVLFAGWDASTAPAINTTISGIHHPRGDAQRLSRGAVNGYYTRSTDTTNPNMANLFNDATAANSTILAVSLTSGIVEPGSSGSGLFKGANNNPQLIGQLYGGQSAVCSTTTTSAPQFTVYGRFDVAFAAGMSTWLSPNRNPVYRFYNTLAGTHFYTSNGAEKNIVLTQYPHFSYEGVSFYAYPAQASNLKPVHRFYNTSLNVHFYTISDSERAAVVASLPQMRYEGIAWYADATPVAGTIPLYRFYNTQKGVHFYTVSSSERDSVIANLPQMRNEGIAYYVLP